MNTDYGKQEIEKVKPLTERQLSVRIATLDDLIARLKRQPHYAPCLRVSTHPRGECICWMSLAIDFLEGAKVEAVR